MLTGLTPEAILLPYRTGLTPERLPGLTLRKLTRMQAKKHLEN